MGVDEKTLALNVALLIGGAILLGAFALFAFSTITAAKCVWWIRNRRKAEREFRAKHLRADGQRFPPFMEGVCGECHEGNGKIFFTDTGEELCPRCYERFWRRQRTGASPTSVEKGQLPA